MTDYEAIAIKLLTEANYLGVAPNAEQVHIVARYLQQLATAAMEHAYPINHYAEGMPLYSEVASSFEPPFPK